MLHLPIDVSACFSQGMPHESLDKMSLVRLRQLVSEIPGATRTKRDSDGKHKEKTKDQLIATIRELQPAVSSTATQQSLAEQGEDKALVQPSSF